MSLRRLQWIMTAFVRRHPKVSFLILLALVGGGLLVRYSDPILVKTYALNLLTEDRFSEGLVGIPQTLNPIFVATDSEKDLSRLIFRGLTRTGFDGKTVGDLAESWEVSSSGQVFLFHLKPGQHFQNGDLITPDDVAFTYELAKNQNIGSRFAETFKTLEIQTTTDGVIFRLTDPFAPFLSLTDLGILPKKELAKLSPGDIRYSKFNLRPVGSTEFRLRSLGTEEAILEKAGVEYTFKFFRTQGELVTALKIGEIKAAGITEPADLDHWSNLQKLTSPLYRRFVAVFYNLRSGPTADRQVRYGFSYGLDKGKIAALSGGEIAYSPIPPVSWATSTSTRKFDYRIDLAKQNLDKSGWTGGPVRTKNGQTLDLSLAYISSPELDLIAQEVAKEWAEIGVRAVLSPLSPADFKAKVLDGKQFQAAIFTQEVGLDPDQYVLWHTSQADSTNVTGLKVPKLDKALEDGRQTQDLDSRKPKYADFQRFLLEEAPVSLLYYPKYSYYVSTKVEGIDLRPLGVPSDRLQGLEKWKIKRVIF